MKKNIIFWAIALAFSCQKPPKTNPPETTKTSGVKVNEILAKGSQNLNEFGLGEDWFELYNADSTTTILESGKWFVSDDSTDLAKYSLPTFQIPAKGFYVIWCDDSNQVKQQVHTNFKLSGSGDAVYLTQKDQNGTLKVIDSKIFGQQTDAVSIGRFSDGSSTWKTLSKTTPGTANE